MRPLTVIVLGLALVVFDFRTASPDLLPDPVGWALVAVAAGRLELVVARNLAVVAGVASVPGVWLNYTHVLVNPLTGDRLPGPTSQGGYPVHLVYDDVSGWRLALLVLGMVVAGAAVWVLLTALARLAAEGGRQHVAPRLRVARWPIAGLWTVAYVAAAAHDSFIGSGRFDPVWNGRLVYTWLLALAAFVWVGVILVGERDRAWALQLGRADISPWELRQLDR